MKIIYLQTGISVLLIILRTYIYVHYCPVKFVFVSVMFMLVNNINRKQCKKGEHAGSLPMRETEISRLLSK